MARRQNDYRSKGKLIAPVESVALPLVISADTQSARIELTPRGQPQPPNVPTMIEPTTTEAMDETTTSGAKVIAFPIAKKTRRGRKSREAFGVDSIYVDPVQSSKNKWTFRVRWIEPDGKRPILTTRALSVADYTKLKRSNRNYEAFIEQLIAVCRQRALRAGYGTDRRSGCVS